MVRLGCRVEYLFRPDEAKNGAEAAAGQDDELDPYIHLYLLNRGILMTPFHNMALMSPATTAEDVDRHTAGLRRDGRRAGARNVTICRSTASLAVSGGEPAHERGERVARPRLGIAL